MFETVLSVQCTLEAVFGLFPSDEDHDHDHAAAAAALAAALAAAPLCLLKVLVKLPLSAINILDHYEGLAATFGVHPPTTGTV